MTRARTNADQAHTESVESIPHIIPGVLYPAVAGKLLDGSTSHSGNYGTAQSDGKSYYYTDIKGSKPIKDPRIGAHFGSQRHKCTSMQLLEQETATHGSEVYSVDGREWVRLVGNDWRTINGNYGGAVESDALNDGTTQYFEVVAYCNAVNIETFTATTWGKIKLISIDGSADTTTQEGFASVTTPLTGRYVPAGSIVPVKTASLSLGIHTFRLGGVDNFVLYGIELIAQDTSNVNNIQIPSQNVVSYGKKFTVSGTPHYDPFNGFTSGTDISGYIDEATSLGMSNWKVSSTWYRPFNGGRVVKWVDSSGTIKTSVTMMPPNAQNAGTTASNAIDLSSSQTNDDTINFNTSAIDNSLSEVAKTYNFREFGNGAANGGTGATWADFSMVTTTSDALAYVMDDGLTSLSTATGYCDTSGWHHTDLSLYDTNGTAYLTFIGTGISTNDQTADGTWKFGTIAQNLPYGTHVVKLVRDGSTNGDHSVDGVACATDYMPGSYGGFSDVTFHQPKKPPIPEDAVVLADYMLMADFVVKTAGFGNISKGVRSCSASRDIFYDATGVTFRVTSHGPIDPVNSTAGLPVATNGMSSGQSSTAKLPYFGTDFVITHYANRIGTVTEDLNSDVGTSASISTSTNQGATKHTGNNLTVNQFKSVMVDGQGDDELWLSTLEIATPTHTSSHYQTFETPFLHELVGGDRNMEQTNLVVTPDGKTWDEVVRDTSYLGNACVSTSTDTTNSSTTDAVIFDEWRGAYNTYRRNYNKDFAIAYDRMICLKKGWYKIHAQTVRQGNGQHTLIAINGSDILRSHGQTEAHDTPNVTIDVFLNRGDYVQCSGKWYGSLTWSYFSISRM